MDNRGSVHLSKKAYLIIGGTVLGIILIAWVLLITGIFKKNKNSNNVQVGVYDIPEVPEGYQLVFRQTAEYTVTEKGKRVLEWTAEYDQAGKKVKTVYYDEKGKESETYLFTYDEQGRVATSKRLDEKQRETKTEYWEYDENDRETIYGYTKTTYEGLGSVETCMQKKYYDVNGEVSVEVEDYTVSGGGDSRHIIRKEEHYQDADGKREITTKTNEKDGEVVEYLVERAWDSAGRLIVDGVKYGPKGTYTYVVVHYYDYDENGNLVTERLQNDDSERTVILQKNTYSEQGILKERKDFHDDGNLYQTSCYDEKGNLIKTLKEEGQTIEAEGKVFKNGCLYELYKRVSDFSQIMLLEERIEYDDTGKVRSREKFSWDKDGKRVSEKEEYDGEGNVISIETWQIDAEGTIIDIENRQHPEEGATYRSARREFGQGVNSGHVVRSMTFLQDGTMDSDLHNEYDANGNLVKAIQYKGDHITSWTEWEYYENAEGRFAWTKLIYKNEDGTVWKYTESTSSQMGEGYHDSQISYNPDGTIMPNSESYSYEYDQYDNPIRYIKYPEGKPVVTEEYLYKPFVIPADKKAGE